MLMRRVWLLVMVVLAAAPSAMAQRTLYVRQTGSDSNDGLSPHAAYRNLSTALSNSLDNDTIVIGAGTWTASYTMPAKNNLTIRGDPTGQMTGDAGTTILTHGSQTTVNFNDSSTGTYILRDLTIRQSGGGTPLSIGGSTNGPSSVTGERLTIDQGARAVLVTRGTLVLSDSDLTAGTTGHQVVWITAPTNSNTTLRACRIAPASTIDGVSIQDANATVTIERCTIHAGAPGVSITGGNTTIVNTVIRNTPSGSSGVRITGGSVAITNCTLWSGGTGVTANGGNATVLNTIISGFTTGLSTNGGNLNASFCLLNGNTTNTSNSGGSLNASNTVTGAPNFISTANGDFRLNSGSAAINAGQDTTGVPSVDWFNRLRDWQRDIGAFERYSQSAANTPYSQDFNTTTPGEFSTSGRMTNATLGTFSGPFSTSGSGRAGTQQTLMVNVTPGTEYILRFDLLILQSWDGEAFTVHIDGREAFNQQFWCACNSGYISSYGPSYTTYGPSPSLPPSNYMGAGYSWTDQVYRGVWVRFTPTASVAHIVFSAPSLNEGWPDEGWGIDNVSVAAYSAPGVPYTTAFSSVPGPEWASQRTNWNTTLGLTSGTFVRTGSGNFEVQALSVPVTANQLYYVVFDLVVWDDWAGNGECGCPPDWFEIWANDTRVFNHTFMTTTSISWGCTQTYPFNPDMAGASYNTATADHDNVFRRVWIAVTPTTTTLRVAWQGLMRTDISARSWSIDNVAIRAASDSNLFNTDAPGGTLVNSMPRFRDVSSSGGWSFNPTTNANDQPGGIHWADFDNDGRLDALITGGNAARVVRQVNIGGSWSFSATSFAVTRLFRGAAILDYDRDGFLDVFAFPGNSTSHAFYRNASTGPGNLSFTIQNTLGLTGPSNREGAVAADLNADGRTDLALMDGGGSNFAAINTAGSPITFPANTTLFPQGGLDGGNGDYVSSADVNNDGYQDFFYHLNAGRLFQSSVSGAAATYASLSRGITGVNTGNNSFKTGSAWGDFNNDGWPDLWVGERNATDWGTLWRSPGASGNFVNVNDDDLPEFAGITDASGHRGCAWGDYNNDGFLDLALATTTGVKLYRNTGSGTFVLAAEGVAAYGNAIDVCFADYDNDGDLDLVATLASTTSQRVFENISNIVTANTRYLRVRIRGDLGGGQFVDDVRGRVELRLASTGALVARRDPGVARGFGGSEPFWAHFGNVDPVTSYFVRVVTPYGSTDSAPFAPVWASTTIGTTTIPQMVTVTVPVNTTRRILNWTQVNPNP